MKKVLALVLALAMAASLTTVAMADQGTFGWTNDANPATGWIGGFELDATADAGDYLYPGETYKYYIDLDEANVDAILAGFPADQVKNGVVYVKPASAADAIYSYDLSMKNLDWTKGGEAVSSFKLKSDDNGYYFELKLKENYTLVDEKDLRATFDLRAALAVRYYEFVDTGVATRYVTVSGNATNENYTFTATVRNDVVEPEVYSTVSDAEDNRFEVADNTVYKFTESGYVSFGSDNRLVQVTARVSKDQKAFLYFDEEVNNDVIDAIDDADADIAFYNFVAHPSFSKGATVTIDDRFDSEPYLYEWVNGKLVEIKDAEWDDADGTFTFKTNKLGEYVVSDKALTISGNTTVEESTDDDTNTTETNPGTGANDFVGLAVALAVVSVAGIAVAKRK